MLEKGLVGTKKYWAWLAFLGLLAVSGVYYYLQQFNTGLGITGLSRDVSWGLYIGQFTFLVLCNHCEKPACVRVCPTQATFKRKQDGIVMMDMHRCIGCRFCMAACPYGARSFNYFDPRKAPNLAAEIPNREYPTRTKGVVEKCTFCTERLAFGNMPACVEAAPKGGLVFGDLEDKNSEVRKIVETRYTIRRKPEVGTGPSVYYLIGGNEHA